MTGLLLRGQGEINAGLERVSSPHSWTEKFLFIRELQREQHQEENALENGTSSSRVLEDSVPIYSDHVACPLWAFVTFSLVFGVGGKHLQNTVCKTAEKIHP